MQIGHPITNMSWHALFPRTSRRHRGAATSSCLRAVFFVCASGVPPGKVKIMRCDAWVFGVGHLRSSQVSPCSDCTDKTTKNTDTLYPVCQRHDLIQPPAHVRCLSRQSRQAPLIVQTGHPRQTTTGPPHPVTEDKTDKCSPTRRCMLGNIKTV